RDARTGTRDACAPPNRPSQNDFRKRVSFRPALRNAARPLVSPAEFGFQIIHARPHPGPLLRGEGEFFAALLKIRATGFADRSSAKLKTTGGFSFSWGRRWG